MKVGRPKRLSEEERRAQVIDAAEPVFLDKGYHLATMDQVASRAGMSKKTLYQVFPTKSAMFEALLADRLSGLTFSLEDEDEDLAVSLENLMMKLTRIILSPQQIRLSRLMISETWRTPELASAFTQSGVGRGGGSLEKWMSLQIAKGRLSITDPIKAANMLFGLAIGDMHMFLLMSLRDQPSDEEIRSRVSEAVALFLKGFAASAGLY